MVRKRKLGYGDAQYLDGPRTLHEAADWPSQVYRGLDKFDMEHGTACGERLRCKLSNTSVVITSCFSGCGGAETAMACLSLGTSGLDAAEEDSSEDDQVEDMLSDGEDGDDDVAEASTNSTIVMYAATDIERLPQKVLQNHPVSSAPLHVFGDVLDRLPHKVRDRCLQIQDGLLQQFADAQALHAMDSGAASAASGDCDESSDENDDAVPAATLAELATLKLKLGSLLVKKLIAELRKVRFNEKAWCVEHKQYCWIHPRSCSAWERFLWVEVAGPCCPPWSSMNQRQDRWLSASTLPALVWLFSTKWSQPDYIIHENSPGWDEQTCVDVFGEKSLARSPVSSFASCAGSYASFSQLLCPTMLGLPCRRVRKYNLWIFKETAQIDLPPCYTFNDAFQEICYRNMQMTIASYLVAPPHVVLAETRDALRRQGIHFEEEELVTNCMGVTSADWHRIEQYMEEAGNKGLFVGSCAADNMDGKHTWSCSAALVNASQNVSFCSSIDTEQAPTLLRRSIIFDLVQQRLLAVPEHWMIQGYPHPQLLGKCKLSNMFPFSLMKLTPPQVRHLTGNGMHIACVGSVIAVAFAITRDKAVPSVSL